MCLRRFGQTMQLIAGDFNIDSLYKNRIRNTLNDNGLKQIGNESTRVTTNN